MVVDGAVVRHGSGKQVDGKETYTGDWHYDVMHGEGNTLRVRASRQRNTRGGRGRALSRSNIKSSTRLGVPTLWGIELTGNSMMGEETPALLVELSKRGQMALYR